MPNIYRYAVSSSYEECGPNIKNAFTYVKAAVANLHDISIELIRTQNDSNIITLFLIFLIYYGKKKTFLTR